MARSVHVLLKKEALDGERLPGKVVVVLDVLFATTTIAAALAAGATEVIPTLDGQSALAQAGERSAGSFVLAGELRADTLPGFAHASPLALLRDAPPAGKALIYSTTNGTVALAKSSGAAHVYAAALVNARAVIEHITRHHPGDTVLLVCAGSVDNFNLEDFYGAGYLASLLAENGDSPHFSDAAIAARMLHDATSATQCLQASRVGRMMLDRGVAHEVDYAAAKDSLRVVPKLEDGRVRACA